jgi:hypothetical protein
MSNGGVELEDVRGMVTAKVEAVHAGVVQYVTFLPDG